MTPIYRCALIREGLVDFDTTASGTKAAIAIANTLTADSPCEQFHVILLDTKNHIIGTALITQGVLNASLVHPREVFRPAILANASSIIVAHNHPSGETTPSKQDWEVYKRLQEAGDLIGIEVLDSIVVDGLGQGVSMREIM